MLKQGHMKRTMNNMPQPPENRNGQLSTRRPGHAARQRGFTAIEIAMVATVIAILALIVLPIFRNRVDEAKIAAARADLSSLQKAETLAQADTGFFLRLEDLDNTQGNPYSSPTSAPPINGVTLETPFFVYAPGPAATRRNLSLAEWRNLSGTSSTPKFRGPYTSFQRHLTYGEIYTSSPYRFYILRSQRTSDKERAAIWDVPEMEKTADGFFDSADNRIPVDPWGNPYLFFPATGETLYTNSVIYSMGPNGFPGDGTRAADPNAYLRPDPNVAGFVSSQWLGGDDDLMVQF